MEWVEVEAPTVEEAVRTALSELGLASREDARVEVLRDAKGGFLGLGAQNAIVKVTPEPAGKKPEGKQAAATPRGRGRTDDGRGRDSGQRDKSTGGSRSDRSSGGAGRDKAASSRSGGKASTKTGGGGDRSSRAESGSQRAKGDAPSQKTGDGGHKKTKDKRPPEASIEEQAQVAGEFLEGLLGAFGLEGDVATRIEDDILFIDVSGDQTEALVGPKGSVLQSVHEITRTVIQRKTYGAPRMRLDIAGYAERRREALTIYARKLADKVTSERTEVMLEPMNAADRKVVHDAVSDLDGVRSFSEGEDPNRAVVLAPD